MAESWQATLVLGVLTLILGIVVSFHPAGSLNLVAVLIGILMILSGIFHLIRVFGPDDLASAVRSRHGVRVCHLNCRDSSDPGTFRVYL